MEFLGLIFCWVCVLTVFDLMYEQVKLCLGRKNGTFSVPEIGNTPTVHGQTESPAPVTGRLPEPIKSSLPKDVK